jgi:hypothetical protein
MLKAEHRTPSAERRAFWIALTVFVWVATTWVFWLGYAGEDDLFYGRYAYLFHRPPMVWWEFRMPAILAIRASFLAFGPSEFAAALPSLLASLAILASVAWFVDWPRRITWQSQAAVLLAAVLPIDVGFRSYPSANQISAGLLALGTVCMIKGAGRTQHIGGALLAIGFMAHEISFFYVALFCVVALLFDYRRFLRPVVWCVALSGILFAIECATYAVLLGDPLARVKVSADTTTNVVAGADPAVGLEGIWFYMWPLQTLIFGKQFGFSLLALLATGLIVWKRMNQDQRLLFVTTFAVFLWLGYGSTVPWAYKPLYRQFHYYNCITLGLAALLPYTVSAALAARQRVAMGLVGAALVVHVTSLSVAGRWGADVDVTRELLTYARAHPDQRFVTDVSTMNQMYVLGGFQLPANVVCLNGQAVEKHLLLNKEPGDTPRFQFPEGRIDGVLVNLEQAEVRGVERQFRDYVKTHAGPRTTIASVRYRLPFIPLVPLVGAKGFMIRSIGGEMAVVEARRGVD